MVKTFFSYSFGCRVNEAEKEEIDRQLLKAGFCYSKANPDFYIVNTCTVTQKAEREARQHIYQARKRFPEAKIVITGCAATYWQKNNLYQKLPVDLVVDNLNKKFLVKLLQKRLYQQSQIHLRGVFRSNILSKFIDSGRLLIKIQDGCQRFCSYCIVPYLRGLPKSYRISEIINKINHLSKGIKEVIFTAVNTEAFGYDTGESFIELVDEVVRQTKISRISFGSIHPWSATNDFFDLYKKLLPEKRLVDFFHIPFQSGSNKILQLMKRGYTKEEMLEKLQSIKRLNDFAFIGTDIIVGFLDETDRDFEDTYSFLEQSPISKFHIFRFSKRQNTAAYYMSKSLTEPQSQIKEKRAKILAELSDKKYHQFLGKHIEKIFPTLFLINKINGYRQGLLNNQVLVFVKSQKTLPGEIKNVRIIDYKKGGLFGKIV